MSYRHSTEAKPIAWIVVGDRARARIFSTTWPIGDHLEEIETLVHPEGQARDHDVRTDGPGRFKEVGSFPHAGEPRTDHRHRTAVDFAGLVAERLEKGRFANAFGHLVVVAPALYLGALRNCFGSPLAKLVRTEIAKDYTQLPARDLLPLLQQAPALAGS